MARLRRGPSWNDARLALDSLVKAVIDRISSLLLVQARLAIFNYRRSYGRCSMLQWRDALP